MNIVFLYILAILSLAYLVSLFSEMEKFQAIAKKCLMPVIIAVYVTGAEHIFIPVVIALFLGWLGDIFLLKIKEILFFRLGLASFLVGHLIYLSVMLYFTGSVNVPILVISLLAYAILGVFLIRLIKPDKEMLVPVIIYETVIMLMSISAIQFFVVYGSPNGIFVLAGSVCFLVSDTMLAIHTFHSKSKFLYFLVMLTYIAAQLCIVLGLSAVNNVR